jgi:hypothetical protein
MKNICTVLITQLKYLLSRPPFSPLPPQLVEVEQGSLKKRKKSKVPIFLFINKKTDSLFFFFFF